MSCPNKNSSEFKEMKQALGEELAYYIWKLNNNNPIHLAPNGKPSKLFEDLLKLNNGDRVKAIQEKARVYSASFRRWFGDWLKKEREGYYNIEIDEYEEKQFRGAFELINQLSIDKNKIQLVGGAVRDLIARYKGIKKKKINDLDFSVPTKNDLKQIIKDLENNNRYSVNKDGLDFLHISVVDKKTGFEYEFGAQRAEAYRDDSRKPIVIEGNFEQEVKRRDFRINALFAVIEDVGHRAVSIKLNDKILDFIEDFDEKIIRTPNNAEKLFKDDPIRLLRLLRFASLFNFKIDNEIKNAINKITPSDFNKVSNERIRDELIKVLKSGADIFKFGIIYKIFPEISDLQKYPEVEKHINRAIQSAKLSNNDNLILLAFLHDIGKGLTATLNKKGKIIYPKHAEKSFEILENGMLDKLKLTRHQKKLLKEAVLYHSKYKEAIRMKDKKVIDFYLKAKKVIPLLNEFQYIDYNAHTGKFFKNYPEYENIEIIAKYKAIENIINNIPKEKKKEFAGPDYNKKLIQYITNNYNLNEELKKYIYEAEKEYKTYQEKYKDNENKFSYNNSISKVVDENGEPLIISGIYKNSEGQIKSALLPTQEQRKEFDLEESKIGKFSKEDDNIYYEPMIKNNTELESRLKKFIKSLGFDIYNKDEIKIAELSGISSVSDLLHKVVLLSNNYTLKDISRQASYIAISMLGNKNKLYIDLISTVEKIEDYKNIKNEIVNKYNLHKYSKSFINKMILIELLSEAIENNWINDNVETYNIKSKYYVIKTKNKILRKIIYLFRKVIRIVKRKLNLGLNSRQFYELINDIAIDIIKNNLKNKYDYKIPDNYELKSYEESINKNPRIKRIVDKIEGNGGLLVGSLAIRKYGTIYRKKDEDIHDLDFVIKVNNNNVLYKYMRGIIDDNTFYNRSNYKHIYRNFIKQFIDDDNFEIINVFWGKSSDGYKYITVTFNYDDILIDFFIYLTDNVEILSPWMHSFKEKIKMGRYKDMRDLANYKLYNINLNDVGKINEYRFITFNNKNNYIYYEPEIQYQNFTEQSDEDYVASEKTIRDLAERLSDRIGIQVKYIADRTQKFKGKFDSFFDTATINLAYATLDTPIHEIFGHPIIRAIKKEKPELYNNLLKELGYGKGKEVFEKVKEKYKIQNIEEIKFLTKDEIQKYKNNGYEVVEQKSPVRRTEEGYKKKYIIKKKKYYTLEEQQEEAIVQLLSEYTADRLNKVKDGKLISLLKRLLKEMKEFIRKLFRQKEVKIEDLPDNMTLGDLADLLAYRNSKIILPGYEVVYTTPDNQKFKTYQEASKHLSNLANIINVNNNTKKIIDNIIGYIKENKKLDSNIEANIKNKIKLIKDEEDYHVIILSGDLLYKNNLIENLGIQKFIQNQYPDFIINIDELYVDIKYMNNKFDVRLTISDEELNHYDIYIDKVGEEFVKKLLLLEYLKKVTNEDNIRLFIRKNNNFEKSKQIIEQWKILNNIQYNPDEAYSRNQGFYSVLGAYADFDIKLLLQNLIAHIEDSEKAGGEFVISAFNRPIDKRLKHMEGEGGKIRFVIYPKSEDIKWAAFEDVYSGSVFDAPKMFSDKKLELVGVSYTKYPSLEYITSVQPSIADAIDKIYRGHNELGIKLTTTNFRIEYDEDVPYSIKKIVDAINNYLDQKYGKIEKPNFRYDPIYPEIKSHVSIIDVHDSMLNALKFKTFKEQAEINRKIVALKKGARKYPRSFIRSEVKEINIYNKAIDKENIFFEPEVVFDRKKKKYFNKLSLLQQIKDKPLQMQLDSIELYLKSPYYKELFNRIRPLLPDDLKISVIDNNILNKMYNGETVFGYYNNVYKEIVLSDIANITTIMHELLHAASYDRLRNSEEFNKFYSEAKNILVKKYGEAAENMYSLQNIDEFLVGIFVDRQLISMMKNTKYKTNKTLFDVLVDVIKRIIGIEENTLYEEALYQALDILSDNNNNILDEYKYIHNREIIVYTKKKDFEINYGNKFNKIKNKNKLLLELNKYYQSTIKC